jgi:hypothetical protein
MTSIINIRFQRKNIGADIANGIFIFLGVVMFYLAFTIGGGFIALGLIGCAMGIYPYSKSKGVLVDKEKKVLWSYTALLWVNSKKQLPIKNYESIVVTTGTEIHEGSGGGIMSQRSSVSFMVYKLYLMPDPYLKIEKVLLGAFYTQKECMMAAEKLAGTSSLPLKIIVRK